MSEPDPVKLDLSAMRVREIFPDVSDAALAEWKKLMSGNPRIDGKELGRLGLVYKPGRSNRWALTKAGMRI